MKALITVLACLICIQIFASCNKNNKVTSRSDNALNADSMKLKITIGTNTFSAILNNNETVTAFKTRLPLTINMTRVERERKVF